jgi:hypothetical protein
MTDTQSTRASTAVELTIATPEGVLFRLPLAGPASRLYAMLLDIAIVLGTVNGIGLLVYWIFAQAPGFGVMVITLAEFAIGFAYGALLEGFWNGQTIGKRLLHLRVIDQAGLPRHRNELAPYARREIYRELATYLQSEISPFPDELVERLSDEQYLINASGILFGNQRPLRVQG